MGIGGLLCESLGLTLFAKPTAPLPLVLTYDVRNARCPEQAANVREIAARGVASGDTAACMSGAIPAHAMS